MGRRGRKRRLALEDEYWRLVMSGVGTFEACRIVGIGRKTGYRWRAERGGLPPVRLAEGEHSGRYLSLIERHRIATLKARGESIRAIASALGRAPSTISRELRRNRAPSDRPGYDGDLAHARARARGSRLRPGKLQIDEDLREVVQERLSLDWSPEQIAAWIRREYADRPEWHVCHETIYQGLYSPSRSGLSRELTRHLRSGRPLRKRRRSPHVRTPRFRAQARLIDDRPQVAGHRVRVGDWEGDLTVGRLGATAIGTLVDRSSRLVRLVHLPAGRDASEMSRALRRVFQPMPPTARRTLTWDQGSEMSSHDTMADLFDEGIYFAHAGAPWQRGTNENTNGLLRHYFPKGTDLSVCKPERLMEIEQRLNQRPRKTLGWRTPADVHAEALACSEA